MERFVSDNSQILWKLFKETGNVNIYLLYHAVQHTDDRILDQVIKDCEGMQL